MTIKDLEAIIFEGKTVVIKGFTSKAGKKFDARLKLNTETKKVEFDFENKKK
jgi:DNA topoisomerase-3